MSQPNPQAEIHEQLEEEIANALTAQKKEIIDMCEGMIKGDNVGIIGTVEGNRYLDIDSAEIGEYNQALQDIINKLKNK